MGRTKVVIGVIADSFGKYLCGQRLPAIRCTELERYAELASTGDEDDNRAGQNARHHKRQCHGHSRAEQAGAGRSCAVFKRRVHTAQRSHNEQIDQRRKEQAGHPDDAINIVDIEQVPFDTKPIPRPDIEQTGLRLTKIMPGNGANKRTQEKRDEVIRLKIVSQRTVGTGINPRQRHA